MRKTSSRAGAAAVITAGLLAASVCAGPANAQSSAPEGSSTPSGGSSAPTGSSGNEIPSAIGGSSDAPWDMAIRTGIADLADPDDIDPDGFYSTIDPHPTGEPGEVVKSQPSSWNLLVEGATWGTTAERIVYTSRDANGEPIPVTGTLITPAVPWNGPGERPVMVHAPGTQGAGDQCAPSKLLAKGKEYEAMVQAAMLGRGWAVAMPDYEGLGTPGSHTYMNRVSQAHTTLDMGRAARAKGFTGPMAMWGFSQGGGAVAAAAELRAEYAPELEIAGAFAGAVPADLGEVAKHIDGSALTAGIAYTLNGFTRTYPETREARDQLVSEQGQSFLEHADRECETSSLFKWGFTDTEAATQSGRPVSTYLDQEPWKSVLDKQRIGTIAPDIPVYVTHNVQDDLVGIEQGRQMVRDWCAKGARVNYVEHNVGPVAPVVDHSSPDALELGTAIPWLEQAVRGENVALTCNA